MVSGPYEDTRQRVPGPSQVGKTRQTADAYWAPVKEEPRWVQYVSDDNYGRLGAPYDSLGPLEPLEPLESAEPLDNVEPLELSTRSEHLDLPDLEFPVPAQDLIPEMVRETDLGASTPAAQTDADVDAANLLIPIQGSIIAHSRAGKPSIAAVTERRVKNTEAARRSRARRADKLAELRGRNEELSKRNVALIAENERLRAVVQALEEKLHIREN